MLMPPSGLAYTTYPSVWYLSTPSFMPRLPISRVVTSQIPFEHTVTESPPQSLLVRLLKKLIAVFTGRHSASTAEDDLIYGYHQPERARPARASGPRVAPRRLTHVNLHSDILARFSVRQQPRSLVIYNSDLFYRSNARAWRAKQAELPGLRRPVILFDLAFERKNLEPARLPLLQRLMQKGMDITANAISKDGTHMRAMHLPVNDLQFLCDHQRPDGRALTREELLADIQQFCTSIQISADSSDMALQALRELWIFLQYHPEHAQRLERELTWR